MEEFESQWKNQACAVEAGCGNQLCSECKLIAASWWRAALERILLQMSNNPCQRNMELEDFIKDELED